ncbi:type II toxin-antitoxin system death-on-curing family toxin [Bartonella queenslandensis]|uniref:type II toxin-antitoxin system death-on-curing family toxin n=1 Tax=Bartonella queenslandensis TaxID=481138 RepID=UPI0002EF66CD|nr:type II toxin-antitoxin system death-on-curing family toxin [Bartonella queenslandensis]
MITYITLVEALAIHEDQIKRYGSTLGVRDLGALETALYRPQLKYYTSLVEEAAALWESLSQNHPFIDGNKRVAFAVMHTFLVINGAYLADDPDQTFDFITKLYQTNQFNFNALKLWLEQHIVLTEPLA